MHYLRWYRSGSPGEAAERQLPPSTCERDGCVRPRSTSAGLCKLHETRVRRHGSPDIVLTPAPRPGAANPAWTGDAASYTAVHQRLRKERGPARRQTCACGAPAWQWSYRHDDPDERRDPVGGWPYSVNLSHYDPLCVPCHKALDLARIRENGR